MMALEGYNLLILVCAVQGKCFNYRKTIIFIF